MWLSLAVPPVLIVIVLLLQRIESSLLSPELFASAGEVADRTATAANFEPAQATSGHTVQQAKAA